MSLNNSSLVGLWWGIVVKKIVLILAFVMLTSMLAGLPYESVYGEQQDDLIVQTLSSPIEIRTLQDLDNIRNNTHADYVLMNDIDASATQNWDGAQGWMPIGTFHNRFTGSLNGNGHNITNLYVNKNSTNDLGLFGFTSSSAEIKNLGLLGLEFQGQDRVGSLVGSNYGVIINSIATGNITGNISVGGLVGENQGTIVQSSSIINIITNIRQSGGIAGQNNGIIDQSYSTGNVSGVYEVGGLVGINDNSGIITKSNFYGNVSGKEYIGGVAGDNGGEIDQSYGVASVNGEIRVGGLVGSSRGTISQSYAEGIVNGTGAVGGLAGFISGTVSQSHSSCEIFGDDSSIGGLVGSTWRGTITNSNATGNVSGWNATGGLIGYSWQGTISKSYAKGNVTGNNQVGGLLGGNTGTVTQSYAIGNVNGIEHVGGLIGQSLGGIIDETYSTGQATGNDNLGGLVGQAPGGTVIRSYWDTDTSNLAISSGGSGKTTEEMMQQATFTGWDFDKEWWIDEGHTYPQIRENVNYVNDNGDICAMPFAIMLIFGMTAMAMRRR